MSTVLFVNGTAHGHINPTLPLVVELVRRGETVYYCSTKEFAGKVEASGARFLDCGEAFAAYLRTYRPSGNHPLYMLLEFLVSQDIAMSEAILNVAGSIRFDYVVHDAMLGGGLIVARNLGVPAICTCSSFAAEKPPAPPAMLQRGFHPQLDGVFRKLDELNRRSGLNLGLNELFFQREDLNIVFTSRLFQPGGGAFDGAFRFVGPCMDSRRENEPYPEDAPVDGKLVYISMGTINNACTPLYKNCIEALKNSNMTVVMSVGAKVDIASLGEIPENFRVYPSVPQLAVLKRAKAFVSHGGLNSVSESLNYGVPVVAIPQANDQPAVARRLQELGAGILIKPKEAAPEVIRKAVETVLAESEYKSSCTKIADSFRHSGGVEAAADTIFEYKAALGIG